MCDHISGAAGVVTTELDRRAFHVAIGAEDTAISGKRFEDHAAAFTIVEILARIRRHGFGFLMSAFGAGQGGL